MELKTDSLPHGFHVDGNAKDYRSTIVFVNDVRTNWRIWDPLVQPLVHISPGIRIIRYSEWVDSTSGVPRN
jgi:hypothetical protein